MLPLVTAAALDGRRSPFAWITALLAVGGLLVAAALFRSGRRARGGTRFGAWIAASSLSLGMVLAGLYAVRHQLPLDWLDIPWMRGVHGTLKAVGFGLCGAIFVARRRG